MDRDHSHDAATDELLNEAEALIWALLDGQLSADELTKLEHLLLSDERVVRRYIDCVQLEVDLRERFGPKTPSPPLPTAVLEGLSTDAATLFPNLPLLDSSSPAF
jgi:anti-sigma factor RsiW